jgi:hypothetical protein
MRFYPLLMLASAGPVFVAAISVTEGDSTYIVAAEDDSDFTVTISTTDGSISGLSYGGDEYQNSETVSSIASGLGSSTVTYTTSGMSIQLAYFIKTYL